ncbi:hypothetical protein F4604DRAFT_1673153 [Suillus subluteus]|nr:hypothetical protein F4604DRAFT_1673153 [Suillus subluteus]
MIRTLLHAPNARPEHVFFQMYDFFPRMILPCRITGVAFLIGRRTFSRALFGTGEVALEDENGETVYWCDEVSAKRHMKAKELERPHKNVGAECVERVGILTIELGPGAVLLFVEKTDPQKMGEQRTFHQREWFLPYTLDDACADKSPQGTHTSEAQETVAPVGFADGLDMGSVEVDVGNGDAAPVQATKMAPSRTVGSLIMMNRCIGEQDTCVTNAIAFSVHLLNRILLDPLALWALTGDR